MPRPYRIVFVCLGNICRSPMAEFALRRLLDEQGLSEQVQVRSAGTGDYHIGERADPRAAAVLREHGYDPDGHRAAQFTADDFDDADLVLALDGSNAEKLRSCAPDETARRKVRLLREFDSSVERGLAGEGEHLDVPDPYYGGDEGFPQVLRLVEAACRGLLDEVRVQGLVR